MTIFKTSIIILTALCISVFLLNCGGKDNSDSHQISEKGSAAASDDLHSEDAHALELMIKPEILAEIDFKVVPIKKQYFQQVKTYPGTVVPTPDGDAHVGSLISGRVVAINVRLGEKVNKGTPLCRIESPEIGAAQAAFIRTAAQFELGNKDLARSQKLKAAEIGSEKNLLEKEAFMQSARAEFDAAERGLISIGFSQAEIENLKMNNNSACVLTLKSPIKGTVSDWSIKLGQRIDPEHDLFHVLDLSRLWVQIALYEKDLPEFTLTQKIDIVPQSFPDKIFPGRVVLIGKEVNKETRTIDCFIEVENKGEFLIPNLFVTCHAIQNTDQEPVIIIPEDAIVIDEHGDQLVYIETESSTFSAREITTGRASKGWVEVTEGLQEGDRVVHQGAFFIKSELAKGSFGHGHAH